MRYANCRSIKPILALSGKFSLIHCAAFAPFTLRSRNPHRVSELKTCFA